MTAGPPPPEPVGTHDVRAIDLLERDHELARIGELLDRAVRGEGCVLLIEGPAGIGKSELLRSTREAAEERGMQALVARGGELERELPFVVVRELLARTVERVPAAERDELMAGAAGLAAAVLGSRAAGDERPTSTPPGKVTAPHGRALADALHGLFWLSSNIAERSPVLLVIDDLHWADAASLRFVAYLAHRIGDLSALLAVGWRTGESDADEDAVDAIRREPLTLVLAPSPLSAHAVAEALQGSYDEPVAEQFARACHAVTGGNPFLLRELVVAIRDEGLRPRAEHAERVEVIRPHGVGVAMRARLARLPARAIELARAMAVLGAEADLRQAARLAGIDDDEAEEAADALVAAELVEPGRPLAFCHPLIRGAIYEDLPPRHRASAHGRAARHLAEEAAPRENVAAHLLHTEPASDDRVVELLRDGGAIALDRGTPQQAVSYLRRALAEPPQREVRTRVLQELGAAELAAGAPEALPHLSDALALSDGRERAAIAEQLAVALDAAGRHEDVVTMLRDEIANVRPVDPDAALRLEGSMLSSASLSGRRLPGAAHPTERLAALRGETAGERLLLAAAAWYVALFGGDADQALDLAQRSLADDRLLAEHRVDAPPFWLANGVVLAAERYDEHLAHVDAAERVAARRGSVIGSTLVLCQRAMNAYLRGTVADAAEYAGDAMQRTVAAGWRGGLPMVVRTFVLALVEQGELAAADRLLVGHGMAGELPPQQFFDTVLIARGTLRLAQGRPAEALEDLRQVARRERRRGRGVPFFLYAWHPAAVHALAALADRDGARRTGEEALALARRWGTPGPIGAALRSLAAADDGEARVERLREAVSLLDGSEAQLERMHGLVDLGAAMRRAGHVADSRESLLVALELAEGAGAESIAERARGELAATGVTRRKRTELVGVEALTPSERRAATLAAAGLSNPEIAQRLFVSRKTVEKHLGNAYLKLKISSRNELAEKLGEE